MHFTTYKLALNNDDLVNIQLEAFTDNVCCWSTTIYMSNVKFVYQLWQNKRNLGCGHAYGNPKYQSPYCTHTKRSYIEYSKGLVPYYLFWFLSRITNVKYVVGNLTNKDVINIYDSMKGKGYEILIGQNDSHYNMLDPYDINIPCFYKNKYSSELNKLNLYMVKKYNIKRKR